MQVLSRNTALNWLVLLLLALPGTAHGATLKVNCGHREALSTINGALKLLNNLDPQGPNTLIVSGNCKENVVIQSLDRLTLTARDGASINDPSNGALPVILIVDSQRVSVTGFTVNGGQNGVVCSGSSVCRFSGNTIQGSAGYGVVVSGSRASFDSDTMQNNVGRGLSIINGGAVGASSVTIQGNGDGVVLNSTGFLSADNSTIRNNQRFGIWAVTNSTVRCLPCTIAGNGNDGVRIDQHSVARFDTFAGGNSITGNGGNGISVGDLSFAFLDVGNTVAGNSGSFDVACNPRFSATRGAIANTNGGTTNCVEP